MIQSSSFLYRHPRIYTFLIRLLYLRNFGARYEALDRIIPNGSRVIDLCAGDCHLYTHYLARRNIAYMALDASPEMVNAATARGIDARLFNVWTDPLPEGAIVLMQGSLCQFIPQESEVLHRMLEAASNIVIISEPIRNISSSSNPVISWLGRRLTKPDKAHSYAGERFNEETLLALFRSFSEFQQHEIIPGGREAIGIFEGRRSSRGD